MDALLSALGKLLAVFTNPVDVVLLLVCFALAFALYKSVTTIVARWDKAVEVQSNLSQSLTALKDWLERNHENRRAS